ncbi:MAG: RNA polymerase sigma-70 factor [Candidatus Kapaibacteriales bacterium]
MGFFLKNKGRKEGIKELSDTELAMHIARKDHRAEECFIEVYKKYAANVNAYCMKVMPSEEEGEDIFQETFVRFYESVKETDNSNIAGYLIIIARNLCLNRKKVLKKSIGTEIDFENFESEEQFINLEKKDLLGLISKALEELPEAHREAFVLREYNGFSYREIAELSETTESNAKSRVHRAKERIKVLLKNHSDELKRI